MKLQNLPNNHFTSISEFILQQSKPLGSGSFGTVYKGYHKMTNKLYAIKIVQIDNKINQPQKLLLSRQIFIHYQLDHPHIIKLWAVIEENNKIYMIMDYAQNGNLFHYLNKKYILQEIQAFKIFYQILIAIQYMHKFDVFHRDIKMKQPENILLDAQINAKLCDFGWVADQINRKRTTFCGTYQYMAPEMVKQVPYDYKIDIWALGVLLYQLVHGKAPFPADSTLKIKQKFQNGKYQINDKLSQEYKQLINNILQFQPKQRYQLSQIKNSSWIKKYQKINQDKIYYNMKKSIILNNNNNVRNGENVKNGEQKVLSLSSTNIIRNILKDDKNIYENKGKNYRKKYKTLEQQQINMLKQNMKITKHTSIKDNKNIQNSYGNGEKCLLRENSQKQYINVNVYGNGNGNGNNINMMNNLNILKQNSNGHGNKDKDKENRDKENKDKQNEMKKKKMPHKRTHTRTGTQTNQFFNNKFNNLIGQCSKIKLLTEEKKKKPLSKRS